jgi:uncharacterized protein (DUF2252 family)
MAAAPRNPRRSVHGAWVPAPDRADPVTLLVDQAEGRVPALVPLRYRRMLASPLAFYRGAAALMAHDLAPTPVSGIVTQLCGDAHLSNFGIFAAPDRRLVFDLNDFDETLAGPWEWDVKRLAASIEIAGAARGATAGQREEAVLATVGDYRAMMRALALQGHLEVWYTRLDAEAITAQLGSAASADEVRAARRAQERARRKDSERAVAKLTTVVDGELRFRSEPPVLVPIAELYPEREAGETRQVIGDLLARYAESLQPELRRLLGAYRFVDMAHKVVGVGSVGTRTWVALMQGRDSGDWLVLQAKEAGPSVLEAHLGPSPAGHAGRRVVEGQRLMQAASDIFLGWERVEGLDGLQRDFYVRQLWDGKGGVDVDALSPDRLALYGRLCGRALARAHARAGDREAIAEYLGRSDRFDRALAAFSRFYAEQNAADHAALGRAVAIGRVVAAPPEG